MAPTEEAKKPLFFTTGSTLLDLVVGGGEKLNPMQFGMGYRAGDIVRDWGNTSSSKSFKLCEAISANHYRFKDKFKWVYDDPEAGNKFDSMKLYGFDIIPKDPAKVVRSRTVEEWYNNLRDFCNSLKDDECGIYGLDSLDSLSSDEMEERKDERYAMHLKGKEFDAGSYGMASAKFLSQEFFRGLSIDLAKKNVLLYVISQERDNVNAFGFAKKNKLGGGRAATFYETVRVYSQLKQRIEVKDRAIGVVIKVVAEKTRHPRPFRECLIPIFFEYGVDDIGQNIDFLYNLRTPEGEMKDKKAGKLQWDNEEPMVRDVLVTYIEQKRLKEELRNRAIEKWEAIEAEIAVQRPFKYEDA